MPDNTYRNLMDRAREKHPWNIFLVHLEFTAVLFLILGAGFIFVNTTRVWPDGLVNIPGGLFVIGCFISFVYNRDKNGNNRRMILTLADELEESKQEIADLRSKLEEVS
jgi:hypothetical protein